MYRSIEICGRSINLEGTVNPEAWDVSIKQANGHREISFRNAIDWVEQNETAAMSKADYLALHSSLPLAAQVVQLEKERLEREERNREKSAQRAKGKCRWLIKAYGLNELLTLTYRENQEDRALCKKHFETWVRRMKVALGGEFVYCASFERQKRGAMHVHCACHKLPKHVTHKGVKIEAWRLGTAIWRAIVGSDNGMCFVGGKKAGMGRSRSRSMSIAKLAAYVSKYIMKDYQDAPLESNRYSRSNGLEVPKAQKIHIAKATFAEMMELVFECGQGDVIVSHRISRSFFGEPSYWLVTEPDPGLIGGHHAH